jgi:hypothetical protein
MWRYDHFVALTFLNRLLVFKSTNSKQRGYSSLRMAEALRGRLPNEPFFVNLLKIANEIKHVIIHDPQNRIDANYGQLLTDVLRMQLLLKQSLPESMFDDALNLLQVSNPYILILSGKYEFIIAALSIMSIGGAFAPLGELLKCPTSKKMF